MPHHEISLHMCSAEVSSKRFSFLSLRSNHADPEHGNSLSLKAAGIAALSDSEFLKRSLEMNKAGHKLVHPALRELGFTTVPSDANFVMVPLASEAEVSDLYERLLRLGVIIRPLGAFGLPHCVRITIGTKQQNNVLLKSLQTVVERMDAAS